MLINSSPIQTYNRGAFNNTKGKGPYTLAASQNNNIFHNSASTLSFGGYVQTGVEKLSDLLHYFENKRFEKEDQIYLNFRDKVYERLNQNNTSNLMNSLGNGVLLPYV